MNPMETVRGSGLPLAGSLLAAPAGRRLEWAQRLRAAGHGVHLDLVDATLPTGPGCDQDLVEAASASGPVDVHLVIDTASQDDQTVDRSVQIARDITRSAPSRVFLPALGGEPSVLASRLQDLRVRGTQVWSVLAPTDDPRRWRTAQGLIDGVLLMLTPPGHPGVADLSRLEVLAELPPRLPVHADGGVDGHVAHHLVAAGVAGAVSGRALLAELPLHSRSDAEPMDDPPAVIAPPRDEGVLR